VADAIGLRMRELGQSRQVLAVTHLPQVAARAHRHFLIAKRDDNNGLNSEVTLLDDKARVQEIARMMGGAKITKTTLEHAGELIALGSLQAVAAKTDAKPRSIKKKTGTKAALPGTKAKSRKRSAA